MDAIQDFYFDDKNRLDLQFGLENEIQKEDIFYYIYAILHDEKFLSTFAGLDSKTQFPVVPFYGNFWQWVDWGRILAKTHQNYNKLHPYPLIKEENSIRRKPTEKPKVKIFEEESEIILSYQYKVVRFFGFPKDVWSYKPGGKSMIQIALDIFDPNDYYQRNKDFDLDNFAQDIQVLLEKIITLSLKTQEITRQIKLSH